MEVKSEELGLKSGLDANAGSDTHLLCGLTQLHLTSPTLNFLTYKWD